MKRLLVTEPWPGMLRVELRGRGERVGSYAMLEGSTSGVTLEEVLAFIRSNDGEATAAQVEVIRGALGRKA